jgi:propanol-preferring alcohol dehydrogenase
MIETAPLDQAANAYAKMMAGKARFRMVLTMAGPGRVPGSTKVLRQSE